MNAQKDSNLYEIKEIMRNKEMDIYVCMTQLDMLYDDFEKKIKEEPTEQILVRDS